MTTSRRPFHHRLPPWNTLSKTQPTRFGNRAFNSSDDFSPNSPVAAGDSLIPIGAGAGDEEAISPPPFSSTKRTPKAKSDPTRDISWSNEATNTLIEAWGDRYVELNRGSLKQHYWEEVAAAVNSRHGDELRCTDIQAKNRIDTVKKKYKKEKSRISESAGKYVSPWPFFDLLDFLVGSPLPPSSDSNRRRTPAFTLPPYSIPVGRRSKRPAPEPNIHSGDETLSRRKFEAMAEAAATMAEEEKAGILRKCNKDNGLQLGQIAEAIEKFGEIYERVEKEKLNKIIELEKHKMQLALDLNVQTMNFISEFKVQLDRNKERPPEAENEKESKH